MKWITILRKIQWGLLAVLLAILGGIGVWNWQARTSKQGGWAEKPLEGLRVYGTVPDFVLIERRGHQINLSDLKVKFGLPILFTPIAKTRALLKVLR